MDPRGVYGHGMKNKLKLIIGAIVVVGGMLVYKARFDAAERKKEESKRPPRKDGCACS